MITSPEEMITILFWVGLIIGSVGGLYGFLTYKPSTSFQDVDDKYSKCHCPHCGGKLK